MPRLERASLEAAVLAYTLAAQGVRSVALAFTDDDYGRTAEATFAQVLSSLGFGVSVSAQLRAGQISYFGPISQMAAAGGDVAVVLGEIGAAAQRAFLSGFNDLGGFNSLFVTSPWFDAAFGPATSGGLDVGGLSIVGETARFLNAESGTVRFANAAVSALNENGLQIGQGITADRFIGTGRPDILFGRDGSDRLWGGDWADHLEGGQDADRLYGGNGNDQLFGGSGNDALWGDDGRDTLQGDDGRDQLFGGLGADRFVFGIGDGQDRLPDFTRSGGDRLMLDDALWGGELTRAQVVQTYGAVTSAGVVLNFGDGNSITIVGMTALAGLDGALILF